MCGIAGIALRDTAATPSRETLEAMIRSLRHRGPDGFGFHTGPGIGLAHARLSIIDLTSGDQPIRNETGSVQVVFNGEIFNYIELRRDLEQAGHRFYTQSDTEVIAHAYEEYGTDFVRYLNGQFAIALWDADRRQLLLARDRVGIRPLLYALTPAGVVFASEAKALFAGGAVAPALDPVAIAEAATYWGVLAPRTAFVGIESLAPGHVAVVTAGQVQLARYWDWDFPGPGSGYRGSRADAVAELQQLFADAVRLQLRADVPVGSYLSGGLDSSAITAVARKQSVGRLRTFSLRFADAEFDEGAFQDEMVGYLGTEHEARPVARDEIGAALPRALWHIEAPIPRTAGVPLLLLADSVRAAGFKVVLSGEGADEVFGGYDLFKEAKIRRFWARAPESAWRSRLLARLYGYLPTSPVGSGALSKGFFGQTLAGPDEPFFAHRTRWALGSRALRLLDPGFRARLDAEHPLARLNDLVPRPAAHWSPLARDQYVEAHTLLTSYLLQAQGDRVAMAASVEGRYPFLDHRLIEFAGSLPPQWKIRGLTEKCILRLAMADVLPGGVARRTKQPYRAPDSSCFFREGQPLDYVADVLSPRQLQATGYFAPEPVARLVAKCARGDAVGFGDNIAFMTVLTTQLLHRLFVDRVAVP
jgi:asparagine synthase (glutamine-hydrolysing)